MRSRRWLQDEAKRQPESPEDPEMNPDPAERKGPVFECESERLWIW